jgi:O-antigen/teichoic acid export membrane protein
MRRKFVSNLIVLLALNFLIKPFYILGIEAEVQNRVGAEVYGSYFALISFSFLLNIILDMGITNYNTRNISRHQQLIGKHFTGIVSLRLLLFSVYSILLLGCGLMLGYSSYQLGILTILGLNQGLAAFIMYLRSNLTALHRFRADSLMSVLDRALLIAMMAVLLWGGVVGDRFHIEWFVYGQMISYGIAAIVGFGLVLWRTGFIKFRFDWPFMIVILRKSWPYALLVFLMMIYYRTDSVMLERLHPDGAFEAGVYAMGFRIFEAGNMIAYLFAILLLPIFSRMIKQNQNVRPLVSLSFKILFSTSLVVAIACFLFDEPLLLLRYHEHTAEAAPVFGLLMISFIGVCITYVFGTLLTSAGKLKSLNIIAATGMVLNVTLNLVLIPEWGALGCAAASCFTWGLVALSQLVLVRRIFAFPLSTRFLLSTSSFVCLCLLFGWVSTIIEGTWMLRVGIVVAGGIVASIGTGMLSIRPLLNLISQRSN